LRLQGRFEAAKEAFQKSLVLLRSTSRETDDLVVALNSLGEVERALRDFGAAKTAYIDAQRVATKIAYQEGLGIVTGNLATLALDEGDVHSAEQIATEALAISEALGRQELIASNCRLVAKALARQGRASEGLPHAERALTICRKLKRSDLLAAAQEAVEECKGSESPIPGPLSSS
jgi:tetratricopeptide (TPR) repeat protein